MKPDSAVSPVLMRAANLVKNYHGSSVVKGVDFEVRQGEVKAILGPSGSGKSTLLRCLALLEVPDAGEIWLDGQRLAISASGRRLSERDLAVQRRELGMVFQRFNLFPHLTVLQNLTVAPRTIRKANSPVGDDAAMAALERVGMAGFAKRFPAELSGGQQQRVAIARAFILNPKVMFFDEPTSALDPELVGGVLKVMEHLASEGMTMVVVTHEVAFARRAADTVVMFDQGEIIEEAPPEAFFGAPVHERTRSFLEHVL